MAREFGRSQRVGDYLQRELAGLIQKRIRDPRIGLVGVNEVMVSRDLSYATVYVTFMDKPGHHEAKESVEILNKAAGFLRTQVAKEIQMRSTPRLRFKYDESVNRGRDLSDLIARARQSDRDLGLGEGDDDSGDIEPES